MSSMSGDENEVVENEPVRRTRSGRALKAPVSTKKTPTKKPVTRATRTQKKALAETEIIEECTTVIEEVDETEPVPENGMKDLHQIVIEPYEESASSLPIESEEVTDSQDIQYENIEQEIQSVSELDLPQSQIEETEDKMITIEESSLENMLEPQDSNLGDEGMNGGHSDANESPTIEFEDVIDNIESSRAIIETEETTNTNQEGVVEELMDVDETVQEMFECTDVPVEESSQNDVVEALEEEPTEEVLDQEIPEEVEAIETIEEDAEKTEPDTEAVSEDEFPTEAAAKEPETEAVSDEELPATATADLGETESVSDDELPPDSEKKRRAAAKISGKTPETKSKTDVGAKRKLNAEGEYDPSSPTSETNDETPAKKAALAVDTETNEKQETAPASPKKKTLPELDKYWKAVNEDPSDFTGWTYLLQYVDQENDAEAAREAYNKFLERYPYCYGYWRKYADYEKKKGDPDNVQLVFDKGLKAISLSVDLWLHYINHCKTVYEKDEDKMREQYERAIDACGLEFRSDRLWDNYIKWELEGKRLNRVMALYDRLLCTPTFGYTPSSTYTPTPGCTSHFDAFQEFVQSNSPNRILSVDDFLALRAEVKALLKSEETPTTTPSDDVPPGEDLPPHEAPPTDEETRLIREKIISSRRKMHKANANAVTARWTFEEGIKRPYFHVKPLERCQLKNWKEYLDFEIEQKDEKRIIILFERCLIACALYDEFWLRFVRYLETLKGDNTDKIRDVYVRACTIHHPKKPNLHLQWATFEEGEGNFDKAAEILENIDNVMPNMLQIAYRRINLERRRNDLDKACTLYEHYISNSKNKTIANNIAVKYARFLFKFKNDIDKAIKVLLKAVDKDKENPRLYTQLIDLGLQRNPVDTNEVVGYMDMFIDREHADLEQRVLFAQRKVEFLEDFSPDIKQVLKAHEQFQKCIKQAKERKKAKREDTKTEASPPKKPKTTDPSTAPPPPSTNTQSTYQYSSGASGTYPSQQQFQGGQYGNQSGYQQSYQQYPPPSDPNYANYQNWQYSQGGPQAYGPYNQWGSYNYY
ncbi:pre-mRNA-processing factor 39 [Chelonus insularis]|uniref:pre-mRNA-processing factor 39 n=1 Tax=Chelonus insularis TaxID=460826 RepID=UPI00158E1F3B|nr:pre-mRNA-processing factor 39 [Chelonus insularis]